MKPVLAFVLVGLTSITVFATISKEELARQAVSTDHSAAKTAIAELRSMGKDGLDALFTVYEADIERFVVTGERDENWDRIAGAIDTVAMQKDAYVSHLYWYTDLEQAEKAADSQHKPILSLRLLGNLNEEFSCANSRFFRALLYSNADISKYLRENYILHWKSVRPAPRVTIDFGDGRKIERTVTGNSIHYILTEKGALVDAIPGLYSPKAFMSYLMQGRDVNRSIRGTNVANRENALLIYRKLSFDRLLKIRANSIKAAGVKLVEPQIESTRAIDIAPLAMTKMITETSILRSISDGFGRYEPAMKLDDWTKLAGIYAPDIAIDASSIAFIRRQNRDLSESEFAGLITKLNKYVALDTTRNDFLLHPKLYGWMNQGSASHLEPFNSRVYAQIFKTPDSDKWLGLYSTDVYTALDGGGVIK